MAARREKGICYNCDERFTPGHRCKPALFLCLLDSECIDLPSLDSDDVIEEPVSVEIEPPPPPPDIQPMISLYAFEGRAAPQTLRLAGAVRGKPVVVLVDGGSTHNFM